MDNQIKDLNNTVLSIYNYLIQRGHSDNCHTHKLKMLDEYTSPPIDIHHFPISIFSIKELHVMHNSVAKDKRRKRLADVLQHAIYRRNSTEQYLEEDIKNSSSSFAMRNCICGLGDLVSNYYD